MTISKSTPRLIAFALMFLGVVVMAIGARSAAVATSSVRGARRQCASARRAASGPLIRERGPAPEGLPAADVEPGACCDGSGCSCR